jgi:hypothetical protein
MMDCSDKPCYSNVCSTGKSVCYANEVFLLEMYGNNWHMVCQLDASFTSPLMLDINTVTEFLD